jgi:hypothetical protein
VADQKTLANFSRSTYYAQQIDREEKLLESIQRGGKDKTWSASTELNREESSAVRLRGRTARLTPSQFPLRWIEE